MELDIKTSKYFSHEAGDTNFSSPQEWCGNKKCFFFFTFLCIYIILFQGIFVYYIFCISYYFTVPNGNINKICMKKYIEGFKHRLLKVFFGG